MEKPYTFTLDFDKKLFTTPKTTYSFYRILGFNNPRMFFIESTDTPGLSGDSNYIVICDGKKECVESTAEFILWGSLIIDY
jgi:hypothetical protein